MFASQALGHFDRQRFLAEDHWRERYGKGPDQRFKWTVFYEAFASALLKYRDDRATLVRARYWPYLDVLPTAAKLAKDSDPGVRREVALEV
mgnify:CR=1 FL=1